MITLLGFGSSARRGQRPWTDRARVRRVIDVLQPDVVAHGASPAGGADALVEQEAIAHFMPRTDYALDGRPPDRILRFPVDHAFDGPWPAAGPRRNARMLREARPNLAAGFIVGKVGEAISSGSRGLADLCKGKVALVILRDDGIEPAPDPLAAMRLLYARTRAPELVPAGQALRALTEGQASRDEVLTALACAREGSRWAWWVEAVERAVSYSSAVPTGHP